MANVREAVLNSLIKTELSSGFSNIEINTTLNRLNLSSEDAGLYTALFMGVCEMRITLDYIISQYSDMPIEKTDTQTLNILRMGIYQMIYLDKIPDYSAVNESVNLAKNKSKGFVNAVLRSFIRSGKKTEFPKEKWQHLSVKYSIPMWIINIWRRSYGDETAQKLCEYKPEEYFLSLRINTLKINTASFADELEKRGIYYKLSNYADDIVKCKAPISKIIDLIDTGLAFVQDEASRIATKALGAMPRESVADVCACPGGKSFSVAIDMENRGEILSSDLHKNKISLITNGAERLGIDIISTRTQNAKNFEKDFEERFDRVICDVPCSGLGVIYKKPDIKYKEEDTVKALPGVQYDILENVSKYVKKGGILLYSTCTLNEEENSKTVEKLLQKGNFEPVEFEIKDIKSHGGMYVFFPHETSTDGFFVAKMKRVK